MSLERALEVPNCKALKHISKYKPFYIFIGVAVRTNKDSYHMHHKFALMDRRVIINGSFNWTRQAITGNYENLTITDNPELVKQYVDYYEELWDKFAPKY